MKKIIELEVQLDKLQQQLKQAETYFDSLDRKVKKSFESAFGSSEVKIAEKLQVAQVAANQLLTVLNRVNKVAPLKVRSDIAKQLEQEFQAVDKGLARLGVHGKKLRDELKAAFSVAMTDTSNKNFENAIKSKITAAKELESELKRQRAEAAKSTREDMEREMSQLGNRIRAEEQYEKAKIKGAEDARKIERKAFEEGMQNTTKRINAEDSANKKKLDAIAQENRQVMQSQLGNVGKSIRADEKAEKGRIEAIEQKRKVDRKAFEESMQDLTKRVNAEDKYTEKQLKAIEKAEKKKTDALEKEEKARLKAIAKEEKAALAALNKEEKARYAAIAKAEKMSAKVAQSKQNLATGVAAATGVTLSTPMDAKLLNKEVGALTTQMVNLKRAGHLTNAEFKDYSKQLNTVAKKTKQFTTATTHGHKAGLKYAGMLDLWWQRFGAVAIGFTIAYRAMNAFENALSYTTGLIKEAITESGELASLQAELAGYYVIATDDLAGFNAAMSRAAQNTMALAEASTMSVSTLQELAVGYSEIAQHGVVIQPDRIRDFAAVNDLLIQVAKATGDNVKQVRSEWQALLDGQMRANAALPRMLKSMGIINEEQIKILKGVGDKSEILAMILDKLGAKARAMQEAMLGRNVTMGLEKWRSSMQLGIIKAEALVAAGQGVGNIFGSVILKHIEAVNKKFGEDRNQAHFMNMLTLIQSGMDKVLTVIEKLFIGIGTLGTIIKNTSPELKKLGTTYLKFEGLLLGYKLITLMKPAFLGLLKPLTLTFSGLKAFYTVLVDLVKIRTVGSFLDLMSGGWKKTAFWIGTATAALYSYYALVEQNQQEYVNQIKEIEGGLAKQNELYAKQKNAIGWGGVASDTKKRIDEMNELIGLLDKYKDRSSSFFAGNYDQIANRPDLKRMQDLIKTYLPDYKNPTNREAITKQLKEDVSMVQKLWDDAWAKLTDPGKLPTVDGKKDPLDFLFNNKNLEDAEKAIEEYEKAVEKISSNIKKFFDDAVENYNISEALTLQPYVIRELEATKVALNATYEEYKKLLVVAKKSNNAADIEKITLAMKDLELQSAAIGKEILELDKPFKKTFDNLAKELLPLNTAIEEARVKIGFIQSLADRSDVSQAKADMMIKNIHDSLYKDTKNATDEAEAIWTKMWENIQDITADFIGDSLKGEFESFKDYFRGFADSLVDIWSNDFAKRILTGGNLQKMMPSLFGKYTNDDIMGMVGVAGAGMQAASSQNPWQMGGAGVGALAGGFMPGGGWMAAGVGAALGGAGGGLLGGIFGDDDKDEFKALREAMRQMRISLDANTEKLTAQLGEKFSGQADFSGIWSDARATLEADLLPKLQMWYPVKSHGDRMAGRTSLAPEIEEALLSLDPAELYAGFSKMLATNTSIETQFLQPEIQALFEKFGASLEEWIRWSGSGSKHIDKKNVPTVETIVALMENVVKQQAVWAKDQWSNISTSFSEFYQNFDALGKKQTEYAKEYNAAMELLGVGTEDEGYTGALKQMRALVLSLTELGKTAELEALPSILEIDAALAEIPSIMEAIDAQYKEQQSKIAGQIKELFNPLSSYEAAVKSLNDSLEELTKQFVDAGGAADDVLLTFMKDQAQIRIEKEFEEQRNNFLTTSAKYASELWNGSNTLQASLDAVTEYFDGLKKSLEDVGAGTRELAQLEQDRAIAMGATKENFRKNLLESAYGFSASLGGADEGVFQKALLNLYQNQFESADGLDEQLSIMQKQYSVLQSIESSNVQQLNQTIQSVKSIDDLLFNLRGGSLAAVQSVDMYQARYATLLEDANKTGNISDFNSFLDSYLKFTGTYGKMNYQQVSGGVINDLEKLKDTISGGATLTDLNSQLIHIGDSLSGLPVTMDMIKNSIAAIIIAAESGNITIPGHASGVNYWSGGLHMVGENGPELEYTAGPTSVMSNGNLNNLAEDIANAIAKKIVTSNNNTTVELHIDGKIIKKIVGDGLKNYDPGLVNGVKVAMRYN